MLSALFGNSNYSESARQQRLWQDREIAFDISDRKLQLRPGEKLISKFNQVEQRRQVQKNRLWARKSNFGQEP